MSDQKKHQSKQDSADNDQQLEAAVDQLTEKIAELEEKLSLAEQAKVRAQADYQNLRRRTDQEKQQVYQTAAKMFVSDLLEPLEQLNMAAAQLNDNGLDMVLDKLGKVLSDHGLQPIEVMGESFDVDTMDCVEVEDGVDPDNGVVVKELRKGYKLGDDVIQHAQVILGAADN